MPPPSERVVLSSQRDSLLPPERVAEPYTIEAWFSAIRDSEGGVLVARQFQAYSRGAKSTEPDQDIYAPLQNSQGLQVSLFAEPDNDGLFMVCSSLAVVRCPKAWYDPACSPMNATVDPRDVCLQTTLWPIQGTGYPSDRAAFKDNQVQDSTNPRFTEHAGLNEAGISSEHKIDTCPSKLMSNISIGIDFIPTPSDSSWYS